MDSHGFSVSTHLDLLTWRVIEENVYKLILEFVFYLFEYIEGANRLIVNPDVAFKVKMPENKVGNFRFLLRK